MSDNRSLTVVSIPPSLGRPALAGALIGAEIGLFAFASAWTPISMVVLAAVIPALIVAGICALVAVGRNDDNKPLRRLETETKELRRLLEKELISQEEYTQLRQRFINEYKADPPPKFSAAGHALWGALWGALVPLIIVAGLAPGAIAGSEFLTAFLGSGAAGAAVTAGGTVIAHRISRRSSIMPELPAGEPAQQWQQLGSRSRDR